jgi:hypothetical protein
MIKFFRKIRQNLLMENKTAKYFKYAIGEIILVVIGILIALGINNWNENRKLRNQEIIYLHNLKDDIVAQIRLLEVYIDFENIIIDHTNDIINHYELNGGFNNMDKVFPKMNDLSLRWTFSNANKTIMQMLNSNQINIIQNRKLKEELIDFNQQIDLFSKNTSINNTNLVDNYTASYLIEITPYALYGYSERMIRKFNDFYPIVTNRVNDNELDEISIQIMNEPKNNLNLINKIVFRNTLSILQKAGNQDLKDKAGQILGILEKEIELRQ